MVLLAWEGHLLVLCWTLANFSPPVPQDHRKDTSLPLSN